MESGPWEDFAGGSSTAVADDAPPWEQFKTLPPEVGQAIEQQDLEQRAAVGEFTPPWLDHAAQAAVETAKGFIPRSVTQAAGMLTPVVGAVEDVTHTARAINDWINGKPIEQTLRDNHPEVFLLKDADQTPPGSKERFAAGFQVLANLGMGAGILHGLVKPEIGGPKAEVGDTAPRVEAPATAAPWEDFRAETARFAPPVEGEAPAPPVSASTPPTILRPLEEARPAATEAPEAPEIPLRSAENEPVPAQEPQPSSPTEPTTFRTSKGSVYEFDGVGTVRNKSPHEGHAPTDVGIKPKSDLTVFVDREGQQDISTFLNVTAPIRGTDLNFFKRIEVGPDGYIRRVFIDPRTGAERMNGLAVPYKTAPEVGLHPYEEWNGGYGKEGGSGHIGNEITEVTPLAKSPSVSSVPSAVKFSREERARQQYLRDLEEEARSAQADQGDELLAAIEKSGGLPSSTSPARQAFPGEITNIEEALRDPTRKERVALNRIFRKDAPDIDTLATRLRDRGFEVAGPDDVFALVDQRIRTGREIFGQPERESIESMASTDPFDPMSPAKSRAIPPIPGPPVPKGEVLTMEGRLPVTMERTAPGTVSAPQVLDSLKQVMVTAGSVGEIRKGRFTNLARGIFKVRPEVVRLNHIDNVPTAVHEVGHALMKQFYGTVKSRGLKWAPSAARRELIGLGKELYGNRKPSAGYTAEGFSEFLRLYLTTDGAHKVAPNVARFFEQGVLVDHPEVAAQLRDARALIDTYRKQGAIGRANTQLVREPAWTQRVLKSLREFFTFQKMAESGVPLRELSQEAAERTGTPLRPSADPYKLFKMKRGASGAILDRMVENGMVDVWGNPTGLPSLREALHEVGNERGNFLLYLFARRAQERWSKGLNPGITKEDATYIRQTLQSEKFDRSASKYYQWWDGILDYLVQADPRLAPTVAAIKKGSSDYAPLARMLDESAVHREAARSQSNPLYRMHGSGLPVRDIFDSTLTGAARLISRANRALVTNSIVRLADIEGMGRLLEEVPVDKVRRTVNLEQIRGDLDALGLDTTALPDDQVLEFYTPADAPRGSDPIVSYQHADGTTRWYHVDPKLYDALNAIEPFSLRSIPHLGTALDLVLGAPKRIFTMGTTGLRASFSLLTNPLRDPQGWVFQTKAGLNPAKMAAAYLNAMAEQLRAVVTGKEGPVSRAAFDLGPQMSQPLGRDINYTKRASNSLFHGRMMRVVKSPIDHLRQLINLPESFPRLAEFQRVGEEIGWKPGDPMSPDQAVQLAIAFKEATVDFSAAGDVSRIVNEVVPFFNPNIQGLRTAARAFRDHPLRTTLLGLAAMTGPTVALWWKNKDKDWYRNLPWRERYYYNNIDDGKNVWQIPRPFEWGNIFQVLPEAALDSWYRQDPEAAKQALSHVFETQNPFDYPVALKVAKEQWQNRLDFWDRPIIPKSEEGLTPGAQVGPYTSKVATWLGQAFPNQVSPRRVDAIVRGFGGGAASDLLDAMGLGSQKATRESELADIPVVGRLWRRGGFYNSQSRYLADFWDTKQTLDARMEATRMQLRDPKRAQTVPLNDPAVIMAPVFDSIGKDITLTLRIANELRESAGRQRLYHQAAEEARRVMDLYEKQQATIAKSRNK